MILFNDAVFNRILGYYSGKIFSRGTYSAREIDKRVVEIILTLGADKDMVVYANLTDSLLLSRLKDDDEKAFAEIYHRYKRKLFLHAYKKFRSQEQAEDVVQDLFFKLWQKRAAISTNSLPLYLYTSVRNRVLDLIAHQNVESAYITSLQNFLNGGEAITDHRVRINMLRELIDKEISELPDKMREVFEMSRKMHLSHRQISEELGISEKTVKTQVNNALRILRGRLSLWAFLLVFFNLM